MEHYSYFEITKRIRAIHKIKKRYKQHDDELRNFRVALEGIKPENRTESEAGVYTIITKEIERRKRQKVIEIEIKINNILDEN